MKRTIQRSCLPAALAVFSFVGLAEAGDVVFEDFEGTGYGGWKIEGSAFGPQPASGAIGGQQEVSGFEGHGLVNSYSGGDDSLGRMTSKSFRIEHPYITFLIGGGNRPGEACLDLVVDGKVVRTATGGANERLEPAGWDVSDLRGRNAHFEIVDKAKGDWGHINVDRIAFTDEKPNVAQQNATREFTVGARWLNFPVKNGAPKRWITITDGDKQVRRFDIELADGEPDWWAPLDVSEWNGRRITVTLDRLPPDSQALAKISNAANVPGTEDLYAEPLRPQYHFSARRGWINDPNGLVYYNGEYHLFFQHNPYGREWGNMHWGHAVSKDLIHWRELGEALYPDDLGVMYSGSAVVDWKNTSGFGKGGKPPMVLFYTAAGDPFTQCMAYSTDGRTFTKYEGNPVVKNLSHDNRDPKVYWHEPTRRWVMAFWGEEDGHHVLFLHNSPDLKNWTRMPSLKGSPLGQGAFLFECPDFFELPVDGDPKNTKWVVFGANGEYGLGKFDGRQFTLDQRNLRNVGGDYAYAAQTYADEPKGRRILVPWLRGADAPGMPFNQAMALPVELSLITTPDGVRLTYAPIDELKALRAGEHRFAPLELKAGGSKTLPDVNAELLEIRARFAVASPAVVTFNVRGIPVTYDAAAQEISVKGIKLKARLRDGEVDVAIFVDRTTVEVFAANGEAYIPAGVLPDAGNRGVEISSEGGEAKFTELNVYELKSAWNAGA